MSHAKNQLQIDWQTSKTNST